MKENYHRRKLRSRKKKWMRNGIRIFERLANTLFFRHRRSEIVIQWINYERTIQIWLISYSQKRKCSIKGVSESKSSKKKQCEITEKNELECIECEVFFVLIWCISVIAMPVLLDRRMSSSNYNFENSFQYRTRSVKAWMTHLRDFHSTTPTLVNL